MGNASSKSNVEPKSNFQVSDSAKSYSIRRSRILIKVVTSRIEPGTGEVRRLNWVTITVSSITKNTGRYGMIHTAFSIFL